MTEPILAGIVGGPLHNTKRELTSTASYLIVPDATDMLHVVFDDGDAMTLFGEHAYELDCYLGNGQERYLYRYRGYTKPKCPKGATVVSQRGIMRRAGATQM